MDTYQDTLTKGLIAELQTALKAAEAREADYKARLGHVVDNNDNLVRSLLVARGEVSALNYKVSGLMALTSSLARSLADAQEANDGQPA